MGWRSNVHAALACLLLPCVVLDFAYGVDRRLIALDVFFAAFNVAAAIMFSKGKRDKP